MHPAIPQHLLKSPAEIPTSSPSKSFLSLPYKNVKLDSHRNSTTTSTNETVTEVIAITDIPRGACSDDINVADLNIEKCPLQKITVQVMEDGKLRTEGEDIKCILNARLAEDCHSYNTLLQKGSTANTVLLEVVRPIKLGDEVKLWFSDHILAAMTVPFLTPLNIQGEKRYVCHRCGRHFEIPNPLKIHLALDCDHLNKSHLWRRLGHHFLGRQEDFNVIKEQYRSISAPVQSISALSHSTTFLPPTFGFKFELVSNDVRSLSPQDLSTTSTHTSNNSSQEEPIAQINHGNVRHSRSTRAISEPLNVRGSAFKPYWGKRTITSQVESTKTISENERATSVNILPNIRTPLLSQSHFLFHSSSQLGTVNMQVPKSSPVSGLLSANSLLMPRGFRKQNLTPSTNFQQEQSAENTDTGYQHAAEMETLVSNLGRSKQGHLCIYCGKIYSRKYGLKIHIRTHTGYKPLKCKFCLRPFGDPSNLNKHIRLHAEGDTPYKCDLCGKILVRRRDLERHIKSRHSPHLNIEQEQDINKNQDS